MKRDMDLIRELLLKLEAFPLGPAAVFIIQPTSPEIAVPEYDPAMIHYNLDLLYQAGFLNNRANSRPGMGFAYTGLSWKGHEFLDSIRDPAIWRATKDGAAKAGGFSVELLGALAKGLIKTQVEKHTGVSIDL